MKNFCFGVDIGGTAIKIGLFDIYGEIIDKTSIKTRTENNGKNILSDIADELKKILIKNNINENDILGVGACVPGPVSEAGVVNKCVNLGWGVFNISEEFKKITGFKTITANDGNAAVYGEQWKGCAKDYKNVAMIVIGTGIGGGIIVNDKVVNGEYGSAGEIGHMTVNFNEKEKCSCGKKGCLEFYSSATGIVRLAKKMYKKENKKTILDLNQLTSKSVFSGASKKDELSLSVLEEACKYLGIALANISTVTDPEIFIIGGGVSNAGGPLLECIEKYYKVYSFHSMREKKFEISHLKNEAGIYGCARLAINNLK